jgi:DNA-binding LacI/PurR family transcriptional regulator
MLRNTLSSNHGMPAADARPSTLLDVASLAGVSRSTASAVLNGACAGTRTSPKTRERVRQAANKLAYHPNAFAQSLRRRVMNTIGFYSGFNHVDARNPFMAAVLSGMYAKCHKHSCDLLIHRTSIRDGAPDHIQEIIGGKVDGVVLWTFANDPIIEMLAARRFPAVAIADRIANLPSVTADDEGGARLVAHRLADRGHRRILYRMPREIRSSGNARCKAFLDEAKSRDLHVDVGVSADYEGGFSNEELCLLTAADTERPTAVACWNDSNALATYKEFQIRGWAAKFALIGFDGFDSPGLPVILSTVQVPWDDIAGTAVDMVREIVAGRPARSHVSVPVALAAGDTD